MDPSDDEFLQELQAAFQVEAEEHLQVLSAGLLDLEKSAGPEQQRPLLETVYREAHSLKGASRAVNMTDVETVCQELENFLSAWRREGLSPSPALFDTLHEALDTIAALLSAPDPQHTAPDRRRVLEITRRLAHAASGRSETTERPAAGPASPAAGPASRRERPIERAVLPETVRISTTKLDALLLQTEEMLTVKQTAGQRAADLRDAQGLLDRWDREWAKAEPDLRGLRQAVGRAAEPGMPSSAYARLLECLDESCATFKALSGHLAALSRAADRDNRETGVLVDDLLDNAKALLLMPFSTLLAVFPKMVRDLARDEAKDVQIVLGGGEVEIDKRILEEIKDPLTHLLRNSVDHGIEAPEERLRRGKPARATVTLTVSQVGSGEAEIVVSDDGAGIDLDRVKESAVRHGLVSAEAAAQMGEAEALPLIFQSEVSTSPIITEISGRGLGMAIVREKVEKLGGRILLETRLHEGTTFRLLLPLTLATFKGILVRAAGQVFVLPTAEVERVVRVCPEAIRTVENREVILLDGFLVPLVRLDDVLELRRGAAGDAPEVTPVVVLGVAEKRIAYRVEAILNDQEVLVKPLGEPLRRVRNVAGATVLGSGTAVPVLSVPDLLKSAAKAVPAGLAPGIEIAKDSRTDRKAILVAEDSITSRMLLKNILETGGYRVTTAVDGLEALRALPSRDFAAIVSDVDMPRMNGFDLTARVRADPKTASLPIVLVTARDSREDRERGAEVGASAYLVKSNFDQSNLLAVIRRLI